MLTEEKLLSLKEDTRKRKISMILSQASHSLKTGKKPDLKYLDLVLSLAGFEVIPKAMEEDEKTLAFFLEDRAQELLNVSGFEGSDWDHLDASGNLDVSKRLIQDKILVLDKIRSPYNVGAVFRSADSFGIKKIILTEGCASPEHKHARRTACGCINTVSWSFMADADIFNFLSSFKGPIIALELGGSDLNSFSFPENGIAVLGSEEFGISSKVLSLCTDKVSITTAGTKGSLNVSVAAGIFLQKWFSASLQ